MFDVLARFGQGVKVQEAYVSVVQWPPWACT